jgi:hypothetical protein
MKTWFLKIYYFTFGVCRYTRVWQNCADITVVAGAGEAAWDVATAEAIARVPAPTKAGRCTLTPPDP